MRVYALPFAVLLLAFAGGAANAQATVNGHPADFDQYPSFIQVTTHLPDSSEAVLRCGYIQNGTSFVADPGYMESSIFNQTTGSFTRYQRIDNKILLISPAPNSPGRYLLQVTETTGLMATKNCQFDPSSETISNCMAAQPFMTAPNAQAQDQNAAQQCGSVFAKATSKLDTTTYNLQKTDLFKAGLRQKVALIEAP